MDKASENYKDGYEKGEKDGIIGNLEEAVVGLLRDDPDGNFAIGYHDGAAGDTFQPPDENEEKESRVKK